MVSADHIFKVIRSPPTDWVGKDQTGMTAVTGEKSQVVWMLIEVSIYLYQKIVELTFLV